MEGSRERILRNIYETRYGWISHDQHLVVQMKDMVYLDTGRWSPWKCCVEKHFTCLRGGFFTSSIQPKPVSDAELLLIHSPEYLHAVHTSRHTLYDIYEEEVEEAPVTESDHALILDRAKTAVGGVVLAAALAYSYGHCMVMDAGHHHANRDYGEGSSIFADVPIAWTILRNNLIASGLCENPKALYLDVDVHHANGFALVRNDLGMQEHFIMADLYNDSIFPFADGEPVESAGYLSFSKTFQCGVTTKTYLTLFEELLAQLDSVDVDIVFYMCNNDALGGDPLGGTRVSAAGIMERDRMFMQWASARGVPAVLMPSGGYTQRGCKVALDSMKALQREFGILNVEGNLSKRARIG